jgi:hypothetical protein
MKINPKGYRCLPKTDWENHTWTDDFVDILGDQGPVPRFRTRVKMAWDEEGLWILAEIEEPHVWGTLTEHDSVIFQDNDFEVFLDPDGDRQNYLELEVNALNTTWDLFLPRSYWDGGPALNGYEIKGLKTTVQVRGTLNNPSDEDQGWSTEILLPWRGLKDFAPQPKSGDRWRINFSRVQWRHRIEEGRYIKEPGPEDNWVWSPQGVVDMHRPETWGLLEFAQEPGPIPALEHPPEAVMAVYWAQKQWRQKNGAYAPTQQELGLPDGKVQMVGGGWFFAAWDEHWRIDSDGRLTRVPR